MSAWQLCISSAGQQIFPIFMNYTPNWACARTDMGSVLLTGSGKPMNYSKDCAVLTECQDRNDSVLLFDEVAFSSTVMELRMMCGPLAYTTALIGSLQFFGVLLGTITWGHAGDRWGRRRVGMAAAGLMLCVGVVTNFVNTWQWLAVLRFLTGFALAGSIVVTFSHVVELIRPEQRILLRCVFNWGIGRTILTVICLLAPYWRSALLIHTIGINVSLLIVLGFLLPESTKWLESRKEWERLEAAKDWINRINGHAKTTIIATDLTVDGQTSAAKLLSGTTEDQSADALNYSIKDLFASRQLATRTVCLWMMWFTASLCSFAIDLNSPNLAGGFYANQFLMCLLITVSKYGLLIVDTYVPGFKRRTLHHVSMLFAIVSFTGIVALYYVEFENREDVVRVLSLLGLVFIEYTWDACYLCGAEGYPTTMRAIGVGSCSLMARVGALFAPQLAFLANLWTPALPVVTMVVCSVTLFFSYLYLPETSGIELTVSDICDQELESRK